ncbi:MAG: 23S rRNA (guanosine(2251)-2'-O)-methyltransferase RlmB [Reyranellaceae bacterium]
MARNRPRHPSSSPTTRPDRSPAPGHRPARPGRHAGRHDDGHWLYGRHAVLAALANPIREVRQILMTRDAQARLGQELAEAGVRRGEPVTGAQLVDRHDIDAALGHDAVHQGIAAYVGPLPDRDLADILGGNDDEAMVLMVLDQVTDPHNVGAVMRSAEAFGAAAVVVTERNAPEESGAMAKSASGAVDRIPLIRVVNLVRELDYLKSRGFWILGLAGEANQNLAEAQPGGRVALVLGAEGDGLRRLTREHCDLLVRLPMAGTMPSLNVSNAAAVALYELNRTNLA